MPDTLRVAVLQDEWFLAHGGGAVSTYELCQQLVDNHDVKVDIFTRQLRYDGERYDETHEPHPGISVIRLPPCTSVDNPVAKTLYFISPLLYCRSGYDVVHAQPFVPGFPGHLHNLIYGTPVVFTIRGTSITTSSTGDSGWTSVFTGVKQRLERHIITSLDYTTVLSVNRAFIDRFGDCHDDIRFLPNGVDLEKFNSSPITDVRNFLFVGRLTSNKRVYDLLQAFHRIHESHPEATLTIVGEGPLEQELRQKVEALDLGEVVSFEGYIPYEEIDQVYTEADVFVLPSEREGHPRVMLEAWASSRPVVGTAVEGIEEFIQEDETGWLVPVDDPETLADRLHWCIDHPDNVRSCGETARQVVEGEYSWEAIAAQTHDIYRELVSRSN